MDTSSFTMHNFDNSINRRLSNSTKWNRFGNRDVIPLWVADMDFAVPDFVMSAIHKRMEHPIFGYTDTPETIQNAFIDWLHRKYHWDIEPEWLIWLPGVVPGLNTASRAVGEPGDGMIVPTPAYYPFFSVPNNGQKIGLFSKMFIENDKWLMNMDELNTLAPRASSLLFCNPQNPTGRVYTREELQELASLCHEHDLIILSDDIHWGFVLDEDANHIPIASLDRETAKRTITFFAPTKTYNFAGLSSAVAIIPDPSIRRKVVNSKMGMVSDISPLAYAAAEAAYKDQTSWHSELLEYLRHNRQILENTVCSIPGISMSHVEGTYLGWIDGSQLPVTDPTIYFESHGLGFTNGKDYGNPGFFRLNFGCPAAQLAEALQRLTKAIDAASKGS